MGGVHKKAGQIYRFDPVTKFGIRLLARQQGSTMQAAVARAVHEAAAQLELDNWVWSDLHDEHAGVTELRLLSISTLVKDENDRERSAFIKANRDFFYVDAKGTIPKRTYVEALWPRIDEFQAHWRRTHREDPKATRAMMAAALKAEGLQAPGFAAPGLPASATARSAVDCLPGRARRPFAKNASATPRPSNHIAGAI